MLKIIISIGAVLILQTAGVFAAYLSTGSGELSMVVLSAMLSMVLAHQIWATLFLGMALASLWAHSESQAAALRTRAFIIRKLNSEVKDLQAEVKKLEDRETNYPAKRSTIQHHTTYHPAKKDEE